MCFVLVLGASLALGSYALVSLVPDWPVLDSVASGLASSGLVALGLMALGLVALGLVALGLAALGLVTPAPSQPLSLGSPIPLSRSIGLWLFHPASMGVIGTSRVFGSSSSSSVAVSSGPCS